jgi:cellulose synthase operon protein C
MEPIRTLNVRFLAWLVASLMLLAGGVFSVHAFQVRRNSGVLKQQAEQAEAEKRFDDAARYYVLYLGYEPSDRAARLALARALGSKANKTLKDQKKVFEIYEAVLREEPENPELRRKAVDIALGMRRFNDALEHLGALLKGPSANDGRLEQLSAFCRAAKNENDRAVTLYLSAITHAPAHRASYIQLAELYTRMDNVKEADRIMLRLVEENKNDYRAHLARARYLGQRRMPQEQERETIQAYKLAANQSEAILAMADLSLSKRKFDEARAYLRNGLKLYPDDAALYLALANVAMSGKQADEAVSILREGLKTVPAPGRNSLYRELALYLIQRGEPERQIDEIVKALEAGHAPRTVLEELQARLLIRKEEWSQALTILARLRPLTAADPEFSGQINYLIGFCHDQRGEPDRALAAYRQAALDNPRLLQARLAGAAALMALGRFDEALVEYRALLPEEPAVGTTLARLLVLRNMRLDPQKQDWKQVDRALDEAEKAKPRSVDVTIVRAQALAAQNKADQAQALLDKACRAQPKEIDLWLALANTAELRGNLEESYQILRDAEERYLGDRVELRLARAHYWTRSGSPTGSDARAALAQIEENVDRFSADDRFRLFTRLGEIYHQAGNGKEARRLWTRAAALRPRDVQIRLALFDLLLEAGDEEGMQALIEDIRRLEGGDGTLWRYARASAIIAAARKGKAEDLRLARKLLTEVAATRTTWTPSLRGLAALDELEGNSTEALHRLEHAVELGDRDPTALRHALQLMYERRQYDEAARLLQKLQDQGNLALELRGVQAAIASQQGNHEQAIALARNALKAGSTRPEDYVWLGQILAAAGPAHHREAEEVLKKATQVPGADKTPESWIALVQFLVRTKQKDKAIAVVEEASRTLVRPTAALALGQCCELTEQFDRAGAYFEEAARQNPADVDVIRNVAGYFVRRRQLARAEPYLSWMLRPALKATAADQVWARCFLAIRRAYLGDFQHFQGTRYLLEQNTNRGGGTSEDRHTLAWLLAAHPHTRPEALEILEDLRASQPLRPEEEFALGQLYEDLHLWPKAKLIYSNLARAALNAPHADLSRVAHYVAALVRHNQLSEAENWSQALERRETGTVPLLEARVRLRRAQGRDAEALSLLRKYEQQPGADLRASARLLEEIGQTAAAEDAYRKLTGQATYREGELLLAEFLARQGRVDEALDLCAKGKTASLDLATSVAVTAVQESPSPSEAQCKRVESLLQEAVQKSPSTAFVSRLAALRTVQGNYADAEALYRQVLMRDPQDITTLNNLAFLLGLHSNKAAEGLRLINRAIDLAGKAPELLDTRAIIYHKLGAMENALEDLNAAIQDAESATLLFHRAQVQMPSDKRAAAASLKRAQELKLTRASLHPLERPAYDELSLALGGF